MAQYGIQWDRNALSGKGQIQWIECKPPNKFLIRQNNQYYSIKLEFYLDGKFTPLTLTGGLSPNKTDYENFGFDDINTLCTNLTVGEESFRPIDKFNNEIEIRKTKEN